MRTFSHGPASRGMANGLIAAFLWSAVLMGVAVAPAGAQVPTSAGVVTTRGGAIQSVAVVSFENQSGYRPETFGQEAADAVATELRDRLNLDVLPKADVELWLRDLGYKPPFSDVELVRLATELEVSMIVTGQVRSARVVESREGKYGEITLAVLLFDRVAQAPTNGALVTARGPASPEASDDTLITKALQQAAFDAVTRMRTRPTVTAMVLWSRDSTVFLNVGGRAGVEAGMKMVAMRGDLRIGMVEVTEASPIGSYATIIQGPPLRTGDHLRGIYQLPIGPAGLTPQRIERKKKGMNTMVLTAAAILGLSQYGSKSRRLGEGLVAAPGFTASNLANGMQLAIAGPNDPIGFISWIPLSGVEKNRIAVYELSNEFNFVDAFLVTIMQGITSVFDSPAPLIVRTVEFTVDPVTGEIGMPTNTAEVLKPDQNGVVTYPTDLGTSYGATDISYKWVNFGPPTGHMVNYRVRPIVISQRQISTTVYNWFFDVEATEFSPPFSRVTMVGPPGAESGAISGTTGTFKFYVPVGADEAIVEIEKDPGVGIPVDFQPDRTFKKIVPGVPAGTTISVTVNMNDLKSLPGSPSIFWWRAGARNRSDTTPPRPFPLNLTNDFGYVWTYPAQRVTTGTTASITERRTRDLSRLGSLGKQREHRRPGPRNRTLQTQ